MNSSTPIADAFNMIVESLQTDFGYLFGAIVEKFDDEKGPYMLTTEYTKCPFYTSLKEYWNLEIEQIRLQWNETGLLAKALNEGKVLFTNDVSKLLTSMSVKHMPEK